MALICFFLVDNNENKVPSPFHFVKENLKKVYMEHETNELMGRLPTPDGNMWLKILPSVRIKKNNKMNCF